jgi:hypothetical protein
MRNVPPGMKIILDKLFRSKARFPLPACGLCAPNATTLGDEKQNFPTQENSRKFPAQDINARLLVANLQRAYWTLV